ncbi:uncharacterized protein LOC114829778 [Esox lucius]|uniref:uncharacterized protein LOC114829778 n=1 Tax=Esox lucius TaxID=8010 RepID=UPI0014769C20|nr:uncharacterized protein LOC114829778 [Esox lucius]
MLLEKKILSLVGGKPNKKRTLKLVKWLQKKHLLQAKMRCRRCHHRMKLILNANKIDYCEWVCRRQTHRGRSTTKSPRSGSLFERSKCTLFNWMKFIYRFAQGLRLRQIDMLREGITGSSRTLSKMAKTLRRVCRHSMKAYVRRKGQVVGRHREFVMIDESNFRHKRKYGRGRFAQTWARRKWVFGILGVSQRRRRPILRLVKRRSRHHLVPLIERHVYPGSQIISDEWRAYRGILTRLGYQHFSVNHSRWFVDPRTGGHTQNLERAWSTFKGYVWRMRGNRTESMLKEHLFLIEWTYWLGNRHRDGPLGRLLKDIRHMFHL